LAADEGPARERWIESIRRSLASALAGDIDLAVHGTTGRETGRKGIVKS